MPKIGHKITKASVMIGGKALKMDKYALSDG